MKFHDEAVFFNLDSNLNSSLLSVHFSIIANSLLSIEALLCCSLNFIFDLTMATQPSNHPESIYDFTVKVSAVFPSLSVLIVAILGVKFTRISIRIGGYSN